MNTIESKLHPPFDFINEMEESAPEHKRPHSICSWVDLHSTRVSDPGGLDGAAAAQTGRPRRCGSGQLGDGGGAGAPAMGSESKQQRGFWLSCH